MGRKRESKEICLYFSMMLAGKQECRHLDFGLYSPFQYATHGPAANREKEISFQISDPRFRNYHQVLFLCQAAPG